jgi:putative endonuclease
VTQQHADVTIFACKCTEIAAREVVRRSAVIRSERVLSRHTMVRRFAGMATDLRHHLGRVGERLAREHLVRLGYRVLAANHRTRFGELDLVVCDDTTIVFVEVKARRAGAVAGALDSVPARKQRQVRSMAAAWLVESTGRPRARELRFDVVGVTVDRNGTLVRLDHLEAAF